MPGAAVTEPSGWKGPSLILGKLQKLEPDRILGLQELWSQESTAHPASGMQMDVQLDRWTLVVQVCVWWLSCWSEPLHFSLEGRVPQGTLPELFMTRRNHSRRVSLAIFCSSGELCLCSQEEEEVGMVLGKLRHRRAWVVTVLPAQGHSCKSLCGGRENPESSLWCKGAWGGGCCCLLNRAQTGPKWGCGGRKGSDSPSPAPPCPLPKGWGDGLGGALGRCCSLSSPAAQ